VRTIPAAGSQASTGSVVRLIAQPERGS